MRVEDGDELEIVHFVGGGDISADDGWEVAGQRFSSRLIVGTGKYKSFEQNAAAVEASGAEIVTAAVRRGNILNRKRVVEGKSVEVDVHLGGSRIIKNKNNKTLTTSYYRRP